MNIMSELINLIKLQLNSYVNKPVLTVEYDNCVGLFKLRI